jgi:hypothetical protein
MLLPFAPGVRKQAMCHFWLLNHKMGYLPGWLCTFSSGRSVITKKYRKTT